MYVNLLPPKFIRGLTLRRQAWRWGMGVTLTLVVSGGFVAAQYYGVVAMRHARSVTAFRSKDLYAVKADAERLASEGKAIEAEIAAIEKARPEDRTLALLGIAATSAKKLTGTVHLKNLTTQMAPATTASPGTPPPGGPGKKPMAAAAGVQASNDLVLEGTAEDAAAIAGFIEVLRETGVFTRVDLTATNEAAGATGAARQFRVDCKF